MIDPRAGSSAAGGAVEAALLAVAAPDRRDLAPPRVLPPGALDLIRVAAEDRAHAEHLAARFGVELRRVEDAALHFVHVVMFHPDSDHFRVLGVRPDDNDETLKLHFRWLQKWLHPDRDPEGWVSVYAERVNIAWAQLRRTDRRAEYRARLADLEVAHASTAPVAPEAGARQPAFDAALVAPTLISSRWARRLPALVIGAGVVLAAALFAAHRVGENLLAAERSARERGELAAVPSSAVMAPGAAMDARPRAVAGDDGASSGPDATPRPAAAAPVAIAQPVGSPFPTLAGSGMATPAAPVARVDAGVTPHAGEAATGRPTAGAQVSPVGTVPGGMQPVARETRRDVSPDGAELAAMGSGAGGAATDRSLPAVSQAGIEQPSVGLVQALGDGSSRPAATVGLAAAPPAGPRPAVASEAPVHSPPAPAEPAGPVAMASAHKAPSHAAEAVRSAPTPGPAALEAPFDPSIGRRVLNQFSSAYRDGQVQRVVVLFAPNARTPEGNLVELHQRYGSLFAASSRRSLEFLDLEWRALPNGIEGTGRYEWAMRPRGAGGTQATAGRMRVVIEFVDGRPLIVLLDQRDVG